MEDKMEGLLKGIAIVCVICFGFMLAPIIVMALPWIAAWFILICAWKWLMSKQGS